MAGFPPRPRRSSRWSASDSAVRHLAAANPNRVATASSLANTPLAIQSESENHDGKKRASEPKVKSSNQPVSVQAQRDVGLPDCDMPSVFRGADAASISARRTHVFLRALHLIFLTLASALFFLRSLPHLATYVDHVNTVWTITLILVCCLPAVSRACQADKRWFSCRAVAESIKGAVWRYVAKVEPFRGDDAIARQEFASVVRAITTKAVEFESSYLADHIDPEGKSITTRMSTLRSMSFGCRRNLYLRFRVRDQKRWYSNKAKQCAKRERVFRWVAIVMPIVAMVLIFLPRYLDGSLVSIVPLIMTIVATATAWAQTMRYAELASSYSYVALELTRQEDDVANCLESDFGAAVDQVESTISKEHSIWRAKRDLRQVS